MLIKLLLFFLSVSLAHTVHAQATIAKASCENVLTAEKFKTGEDGWERFLKTIINPFPSALHCAPAKKYCVDVKFIIGRNGWIEWIKAQSSVGYSLEEEVSKAIWQSPRWTPATQNGRPVKSYRCQTFCFDATDIRNIWL